uniref:Ribosomal protein L20 n=1 Tax=Romanomermis culicivorax TaxID=13658 RepID=A0A915L454_ROMCU
MIPNRKLKTNKLSINPVSLQNNILQTFFQLKRRKIGSSKAKITAKSLIKNTVLFRASIDVMITQICTFSRGFGKHKICNAEH